jgi:hypothetical protein
MTTRRQRPRTSRRFVAVFATLALFGALVAVTQVAGAHSRRGDARPCPPAGSASPTGSASASADTAAAADAHDHGDGADAEAQAAEAKAAEANAKAAEAQAAEQSALGAADGRCRPTTTPTTSGPTSPGNPGGGTTSPPPALEVLGTTCEDSQLPAHEGFQVGSRCVSTAFGEVGEAENNPTLLITRAPLRVRANTAFSIQVSTRNLVRNRFLPAKDGGYYRESAYLNEDGLVQGHFHTACRMLTTRRSAPDPAPVPVFFLATEDGQGGAEPDVVTVQVPGLPSTGIAQCAAWAGDGSHRIPMMMRANQIPAFDSVRILVTR